MVLLLRSLSALLLVPLSFVSADTTDLKDAQVLIRGGSLPAAEQMAATILVEESAKRTGITWKIAEQPPQSSAPRILLAQAAELPAWKELIPLRLLQNPILQKREGYVIEILPAVNGSVAQIVVLGADSRGLMFGAGKMLRLMDLLPGSVTIDNEVSCASSPDRAIRGHQIGYRPRANSWDAWTVEQFDQYFRDMVIFGANCIENIPLQDNDPAPLMKYSREEMNVHFAKLCARYDLDHWVWIPVEFPVEDQAQCDAFLARQESLYKACSRLDAVFVPGGDPGHNACKPLMPYLKRMAETLQKHHPQAKLWLSLQGFKKNDIDDFYAYLAEHQPQWFGGAVMGPSSPPMETTRARLPKQYPLRWYPDLTHNVRCQYPIPWLDPAWGLTVGREGVNPRPEDFVGVYQNDYRLTDGFLSYSDGIHDDFNKNLWSQLAWDPTVTPREFARDYARHFFRSDLGDLGADALLGLETNLRGPAVDNGSVEGTWRLWQQIVEADPAASDKWRLQMHRFRACYDTYVRRRQIYENQLEATALQRLQQAGPDTVPAAVHAAIEILNRAETQRTAADLLKLTEDMADALFAQIGYQTSVPKHKASGYERGCMMDYINYPLNNRWWLEDQLNAVLKMNSPQEQLKRIEQLVQWENPGPHGYYEVLGHVGRSSHVIRLQNAGDSMRHYYDIPMPTQRNMDPQRQSLRFAWHSYLDDIPGLRYNGLDPQRKYTIRLFAQRDSPLEIDGVAAKRIRKGDTYGKLTEQEFEVPAEALKDGVLTLTWSALDELHLNWREKHYVTDLWVQSH
jgi:hypothetical protein